VTPCEPSSGPIRTASRPSSCVGRSSSPLDTNLFGVMTLAPPARRTFQGIPRLPVVLLYLPVPLIRKLVLPPPLRMPLWRSMRVLFLCRPPDAVPWCFHGAECRSGGTFSPRGG
jgi:hypothetical protein